MQPGHKFGLLFWAKKNTTGSQLVVLTVSYATNREAIIKLTAMTRMVLPYLLPFLVLNTRTLPTQTIRTARINIIDAISMLLSCTPAAIHNSQLATSTY